MKFYSTADSSEKVDFRTAIFQGLPKSGGLYHPERIPQIFNNREDYLGLSPVEIGLRISKAYIGNEIQEEDLEALLSEVISFDFPLVKVSDHLYTLELFHGPTWAFKDLGARFLSRCLGYFTKSSGEEITILVATSGDTGSAVAAGFFDVPGVHVKILFPKGKVSEVQQLQLTTWGKNIETFEVDGNFDDCQRMVKTAFNDEELNSHFKLSSANSINIARLIPQSFYYFYASQQLKRDDLPVIAVPSGNFGNLTAGLLAWKMGLAVKRFIAATNVNHVVPDYLETGDYQPMKSIETYANAMDVGDPSNFVRMQELFGSHDAMKDVIQGFWLDNTGILESMKNSLEMAKYLPDPHGAIGLEALHQNLQPGETGVFLETAHPVKFLNVVDKVAGEKPDYGSMIKGLQSKKPSYQSISSEFSNFKEILLD